VSYKQIMREDNKSFKKEELEMQYSKMYKQIILKIYHVPSYINLLENFNEVVHFSEKN
jgi:hypothetical protein